MGTTTTGHVPGLQRYANRSGHSGVAGYAAGRDAITLEFTDGTVYLYSYDCPGRRHVERMKTLASDGSGLGTYINRHVGKRFAAQLV